MNSKALICEFSGCKLILENPVTMPCGNTICKHHLKPFEKEQNYNCFFCQDQHDVPKNGFSINKAFDLMIQTYFDSNPIRKRIIETLERLSKSKKNYEPLDPDVYVYDYFAEIRNKVDLHREELIKEIHERSEAIIKQLKEKEEKCKLNAAKIGKNKFEIIKSWKLEARKAEKNQDELSQLLNKIKRTDFEKQLKNDLVLGECIQFEKHEKSSTFGYLKITKNDFILTKNCGKLVKSYKEHSFIKSFLFRYTESTKLIRSIQVDELSSKLVTASEDNTIKIWNLDTDEFLKKLTDHKNWVTGILILPNNKLISASCDKTLKIWDLNSYECLITLVNQSEVYSLCLISHNQIACGCGDGSINIWNLNNSKQVKSFKAHDDLIRYLLFVNNTKLISCSNDKKIKIWSLKTYECNKILEGHSDTIYFVNINSNGNLLSCSMDKTLKLWETETGEMLKSTEFKHQIFCIKILNEDLVAVGLQNGEIIIFDFNASIIINRFRSQSSCVNRLYLLSDGDLISGSIDGQLKIWKIFD